MKTIAIIPARYASTRFPGKPLALLGGKPVIRRVYEQVSPHTDLTVVATDDARIYDAVTAFHGHAVMTRTDHKSGTDRVFEAYQKVTEALHTTFDVIINVQGDEPFIHPTQLQTIKDCFLDPATQVATLAKPFTPDDGLAALKNPNSPKVVTDNQGNALYFSRSVIPYLRNIPEEEWLSHHTFLKHIGLYAYRPRTLARITTLDPSPLELAESLEQLRWLQHNIPIQVRLTTLQTVGIDTPQDLLSAEQFLQQQKQKKGSL